MEGKKSNWARNTMEKTESFDSSKSAILNRIKDFQKYEFDLKGLVCENDIDEFVTIISDSIKKVSWIIESKPVDFQFNPQAISEEYFPYGWVKHLLAKNDSDEACWLLFLISYVGYNSKSKWNLLKGIYTALDAQEIWSWERINGNVKDFQNWLIKNQVLLYQNGNLGDNYKHPVMDMHKATTMAKDIENYVFYMAEFSNHAEFFANANTQFNSQPDLKFNYLLSSLNKNLRSNNLVHYNYLNLIDFLDITELSPNSFYLNDSSFVKRSAKLLMLGKNKIQKVSLPDLDKALLLLSGYIHDQYGNYILHSALGKWGKERIWNKKVSFKK